MRPKSKNRVVTSKEKSSISCLIKIIRIIKIFPYNRNDLVDFRFFVKPSIIIILTNQKGILKLQESLGNALK